MNLEYIQYQGDSEIDALKRGTRDSFDCDVSWESHAQE